MNAKVHTFDVIYKNPCVDTDFVEISVPTLDDYSYIVNSDADTTAAHKMFSYVTTPVTHTLCGAFSYTVLEADDTEVPTTAGDPTTYNTADQTFTFDSDNADLDGTTKTYTIVAAFTDYDTAETKEADFDVVFVDPCEDPFTLTSTAQTAITDNFSETAQPFDLTPFTVTPSRCEIQYSCDSVTKDGSATTELNCASLGLDGIFNSEATDGKGSITATQAAYLDGSLTPGVFTFNLVGTVVDATSGVTNESKPTTITVTLVDPCDPPNSVVAPTTPAFADQSYIITDASKDYTHPDFVVEPLYCPVTYSYVVTDFTDDSSTPASAITRVDETFTFEYGADLSPVSPTAQTQTVTVTATSTSIYTTVNTAVTASDSFDLSFSSPCELSRLTTISSTAQTNPAANDYD